MKEVTVARNAEARVEAMAKVINWRKSNQPRSVWGLDIMSFRYEPK